MAINFPKINIAESVVNRILNINDELNTGKLKMQLSTPRGLPEVPDTDLTGPALNQTLYTPPAPSDADPELAEAVALKGLL